MRLALRAITAATPATDDCGTLLYAWVEEQLHRAAMLPMQAGALPKAIEQASRTTHLGASIAVGRGALLISSLAAGLTEGCLQCGGLGGGSRGPQTPVRWPPEPRAGAQQATAGRLVLATHGHA